MQWILDERPDALIIPEEAVMPVGERLLVNLVVDGKVEVDGTIAYSGGYTTSYGSWGSTGGSSGGSGSKGRRR